MNILEKIESLEDCIESLEKELLENQSELRKLLKCANSHCLRNIELSKRITTKDDNAIKFLNVLSEKLYNDLNVKVNTKSNKLYVKMNDFLNDNFEDFDTRFIISRLKEFGLINGTNCEYYKSTRINGKISKCIVIDFNKFLNLVSNCES